MKGNGAGGGLIPPYHLEALRGHGPVCLGTTISLSTWHGAWQSWCPINTR